MRGIKSYELKIENWKGKAKERAKLIHVLTKRKKELIKSRDLWKGKYQAEKLLVLALLKRIKELERGPKGTKVAHHSYTSEEIQLSVQLRAQGGCSFRSCTSVLQILFLWLGLNLSIPSPSSIRNWEIKLGYAGIARKDHTQGEWAIIMDESIALGGQKMLLFLGVNLHEYDFSHPLRIEDVSVLHIALKQSWKGEEIQDEINTIRSRKYNIVYCCCDNGNNLRKALKLSNLSHVDDCTHSLGKLIERRYKENEQFKNFTKKAALFKRQNSLSKFAEYTPPKQRSKGRFLNLGPLEKWGSKILKCAKIYAANGINLAAYERIKWILEYEDFIKDLSAHQRLINKLLATLKKNGLTEESKIECEKLVGEASLVGELFKEEILAYLERNKAVLADKKQLLCSSDVIESIFGKLKNRVSSNPEVGLTEGCLSQLWKKNNSRRSKRGNGSSENGRLKRLAK